MSLIAERTIASRAVPFGEGELFLDEATGAPVQFVDRRDPARRFLLDLTRAWHSVEHQWGSGFAITDAGSHRWNVPDELVWNLSGNSARHELGAGLAVSVEREWGDGQLRERYAFANHSATAVRLRSIGVQTPFNDVYEGARGALEDAVHAHVWTGGSWAWVIAQPMSGRGRVLALELTKGALQTYSVESRNPNTLSNARGHILLQPTDEARNPSAMGGQTPIDLAPGATWTLEWAVGWHDTVDAFLDSARTPAQIGRVAVPFGQELTVLTDLDVSSDSLGTRPIEGGVALSARSAGAHSIRIGEDARTDVLFHPPVEQVVGERAAYILRHQTTPERPGTLAHALVPVNTETLLTQLTNGWSDWTDGSERIGMAILLQQARTRGLIGAEADAALDGWAAFAREHLLDDTAAPRRGSQDHHTGPRLYDAPWLAIFFALRARHLAGLGGPAVEELDLAARILDRAYDLGAESFLAILQAEAVALVADTLDALFDTGRAARLRARLVASAQHFVRTGRDLPAHEVAYEQTIVGPLVSLLSEAYRISGDKDLLPEISERVEWLLAFGGPQPHVRLRDIAIRHWDGYWFGQRRQWGDVFPHYWSSVTALALHRLPDELRTPELRERADAILAANLINFGRDGWATCAYVFPSTVDSEPASHADPLANDQDWHLVMWLMLHHEGRAELG